MLINIQNDTDSDSYSWTRTQYTRILKTNSYSYVSSDIILWTNKYCFVFLVFRPREKVLRWLAISKQKKTKQNTIAACSLVRLN